MSNRIKASTITDDSEDQHIERNKVVVRVPATSANLGPGFDAIGMALDMWSEITVERSDTFEIVCEGEGASDMPLDETNLVFRIKSCIFNFFYEYCFIQVCFGLIAAFKNAQKPVPTLKYRLVNRIPYGCTTILNFVDVVISLFYSMQHVGWAPLRQRS